MSDNNIASLVFAVQVSEELMCKVKADSAHVMDGGSVRFIIHNDCKSTVALFKKFDYFFVVGVNE